MPRGTKNSQLAIEKDFTHALKVTNSFIIYLMLIHGLVDRGELNFDKSFLQFNVKKKYVPRVTLKEHSQFD